MSNDTSTPDTPKLAYSSFEATFKEGYEEALKKLEGLQHEVDQYKQAMVERGITIRSGFPWLEYAEWMVCYREDQLEECKSMIDDALEMVRDPTLDIDMTRDIAEMEMKLYTNQLEGITEGLHKFAKHFGLVVEKLQQDARRQLKADEMDGGRNKSLASIDKTSTATQGAYDWYPAELAELYVQRKREIYLRKAERNAKRNTETIVKEGITDSVEGISRLEIQENNKVGKDNTIITKGNAVKQEEN